MKLLDLFCGAGGAGTGYHRAGFDVTGVDIKPMPRYPFTFIQADALEYVAEHGHEYDVIHASPPCQRYSPLSYLPWLRDRDYWDSIPPTRAVLLMTGRPYVIENVAPAPLDGITLCGTMFGLRVFRHRKFESSVLLLASPHVKHSFQIKPKGEGHLARNNCMGTRSKGRKAHYEAGGFVTVAGDIGRYAGTAMGIDWMTGDELSQAIPPAYTEFIGKQLLNQMKVAA